MECVDTETRSELGGTVLIILDIEAARARRGLLRIPLTRLDDLWHWSHSRGDHRM